jgi:hypothetical protein
LVDPHARDAPRVSGCGSDSDARFSLICFDVVALQVLVEQSLQSRLIRQANDRFDNFATFEK